VRPAHRRGVPGWLSQVIVRGLAFDPDDRWPSMQALVAALDSGLGRGLRRRRQRRLVASAMAAAAAIAVAAAGLGARDRDPPPSCREAVRGGNDAVTILVCKDEYTRTADPRVGVDLANALRRAGQLDQATAVASQLLATPVKADALYTLGKIAADEDRPADAERSLRLAGELHRGQERWADAATDLLALVGVSSDVVDRLAGLDQAMIDAHRGGDARIEAYCQ
jgi:tetratricopeptide (TPR) repeat protein